MLFSEWTVRQVLLHESHPFSDDVSVISDPLIMSNVSNPRVDCDTRIFSCKLCTKTFKRARDLRKHIKIIHSSKFQGQSSVIKPCEICLKVFTKSNLRSIHMQHEHPEYRFTCRLCPRSFANKDAQFKHEMSVHNTNVDNPDQIFNCNKCNKAYATRRFLLQHLKTHHMIK